MNNYHSNGYHARVAASPSQNGAALALQKRPVLAASPLIQPVANTNEILKAWQNYQELKAKLLDNNDYQIIRAKKYIKKSGWRKIQTAFAISDELIKEERKEYKNNVFVYELTVKVSSQNGRFAYGVGSCASNERNFAHPEHDVRSTAHTRSKNRGVSDLVGFGELSAEEVNYISSDNSASNEAYEDSEGFLAPVYADNEDSEANDAPITAKQRSYLGKLIYRRCNGGGEQYQSMIEKIEGLNKRQASRMINALLIGSNM